MPALSSAVLVLAFAGFAVLGVVLAVIDIRHHRLPNRLVALGAAFGVLSLGVAAVTGGRGEDLLRALLAGVAVCAAYLALRLLSPSGIGGGDVKLAAVVGLYLGWQGWEAVLIGTLAAFVLGGVVASVCMATGRAGPRTAVPFGPFMIIGAWLGIVLTLG